MPSPSVEEVAREIYCAMRDSENEQRMVQGFHKNERHWVMDFALPQGKQEVWNRNQYDSSSHEYHKCQAMMMGFIEGYKLRIAATRLLERFEMKER